MHNLSSLKKGQQLFWFTNLLYAIFEFGSFLTKNFWEINFISLFDEFFYFLYVFLSISISQPMQQESMQLFPKHLKSFIYSGTKKFWFVCMIIMIFAILVPIVTRESLYLNIYYYEKILRLCVRVNLNPYSTWRKEVLNGFKIRWTLVHVRSSRTRGTIL